jgi:type I site-specific restriction endonuclease
LKPEEEARKKIDTLLEKAGWLIQDYKALNLGAGAGIAVREFPLKGAGFADYLLFVERHAVGVVEAKPEGTTLSGVSEQTEKYLRSLPEHIPHIGDVLPFAYESTGSETFFRDLRDPEHRSRRVFAFHMPETLHEWVHQELANALQKQPYNLSPGLVWLAYQQLEKSKVKGTGPQKLLTDTISLIRFATGQANILEPFEDEVNRNFNNWLENQESHGTHFTPEQTEWLNMIKQHITTSLNVGIDDFELSPFNQKGGAVKAYQLFGKELNKTLQELNTVLTK